MSHITDTLDVSKKLQENEVFSQEKAEAIATVSENAMKSVIELIDQKFDHKFDHKFEAINHKLNTLQWFIGLTMGFFALLVGVMPYIKEIVLALK